MNEMDILTRTLMSLAMVSGIASLVMLILALRANYQTARSKAFAVFYSVVASATFLVGELAPLFFAHILYYLGDVRATRILYGTCMLMFALLIWLFYGFYKQKREQLETPEPIIQREGGET